MEQQLKQRLVGAVVLVSLAVIFIPVILEGPGDEWTPRNQNIPQPPPLDFRTDMELPLPEFEGETAAGPVAASPGQTQAVPVQADGAETGPEPVSVPAEPEPAPPPVAAAPVTREPPVAAAPADGWYAQVGSFSQQDNAAGLRERLGKAGYPAHLQQTDIGKGSSYRVLVGPEKGRENAEKLLRKLARELQLKGIVIELPATTE